MKQSWQRFPGLEDGAVSLVNSLHMLDSASGVGPSLKSDQAVIEQELQSMPFEAFILCCAKLDDRLQVAGFIQDCGANVDM